MKKLTSFIISLAVVFIVSGIIHADLNDGLVAYYPFNGNVNDASGNGNDAINHGATLTEDRFGNPDSAYEIAGNSGGTGLNNWIEIPDIIDGFTDLTISIWVKEESIGYKHGEVYITFGTHFDDLVEISRQIWADGQPYLPGTVNFGVNATWIKIDFSDTWYGEYQHYALVYKGDSGLVSAYHNGTLVGQDYTSPGTISTYGDYAALGAHWWNQGGSVSNRLNGAFDDILIYNKALNADEIFDLYNAQNPVPEPTIDAILIFFDNSVDEGLLEGKGRGWLAEVKLCLFRKMLEAAGWFIEKDKMKPACHTLHRAYLRCDGERRPLKDIIVGDAVPELAEMIRDLMDELGCE